MVSACSNGEDGFRLEMRSECCILSVTENLPLGCLGGSSSMLPGRMLDGSEIQGND